MVEELLRRTINENGLKIEIIEPVDKQKVKSLFMDNVRFEEVYVVGSMAGVPSKVESSSCYLVKGEKKQNFFVDIAYGGVSRDIQNISGAGLPDLVFLTHLHSDHAAGLTEYVRFKEVRTVFDGKEGEVTVVMKKTVRALWKILEVLSAYVSTGDINMSVKIRFVLLEPNCVYEINGVKVSTFNVNHDESSIGYVFEEINPKQVVDVHKLDEKGISRKEIKEFVKTGTYNHEGEICLIEEYMKSEKLKKIVFYGDTTYLQENEHWSLNAELAVHEGTYMEDVEREYTFFRKHSYVHEIVGLSDKAKKVLLTHHSKRYTDENRNNRLEEELRKNGIENKEILIAKSGMQILF